MRESKAELTDRLRREGRWDAFKKRREELKAGGVPAREAWYQAAAEFPPDSPRRSIEPCVEWVDGKGDVEGAKDDLEWLLAAMYVKLPPGVGSAGRRALLEQLRTSSSLCEWFSRQAIERICAPRPAPPRRTLSELLGSQAAN